MPRKSPPPPPDRPRLTGSRKNAHELIRRQIQAGEELLASWKTATTANEFASGLKLWRDYTFELLRNLFTTDAIAEEFARYPSSAWDRDSLRYLANLKRELDKHLLNLRSILQRVDLFAEVPTVLPTTNAEGVAPPVAASRDVFVVHGRDNAIKESVARFLEKLGLRPIILHEQADKGRTVIEKFEDHSNVGFVVVLLTPDDEGRLRGSGDNLELRARQNVILELGYFIGKLGRNRVCALRSADVEAPSDIHGVLYVPLDHSDARKLLLAKELKAANIDVDLNLAV